MSIEDKLGDRMKLYEKNSSCYLDGNSPFIVRVDGRSFSKFCKRFSKPYDTTLHAILNEVLRELCKDVPGVRFAERHSDELSLLVFPSRDNKSFFGGNIQKISSVVASLATSSFCRHLLKDGKNLDIEESWPCFDARCFSIPLQDIPNYFVWRNKDATRNSINMNASSFLSHGKRKDKSCADMIGIMKKDFLFDWDLLPNEKKAGYVAQRVSVVRETKHPKSGNSTYTRDFWEIVPAPYDCMKMKAMVAAII